jgi:hypothetical protein
VRAKGQDWSAPHTTASRSHPTNRNRAPAPHTHTGPGSGKTRVVTARVAHLLRGGLPPYRTLTITFTNKAADELKGRLEGLVGGGMRGRLRVLTFHQLCASLLG